MDEYFERPHKKSAEHPRFFYGAHSRIYNLSLKI